MARDFVLGRVISSTHLQTMEHWYPKIHDDYARAQSEWQMLNETLVVRGVTYTDLLEKPTESLLEPSRAGQTLEKLLKLRAIWIGHKERLKKITKQQTPLVILERTAIYLTL